MRKTALGVVLAMVALLGAYGTVAAAPTSTAKVVIIVGADTPQYIDDANEVYAEAIKYTSNVIKVYSPNATWNAVKSATTGANVVIYLGHGNGFPSPYGSNPNGYITKDGFGLNATAAGTHYNLKYYGEPSIRTLNLAPNAVIFLFHLCYASGNSEPGDAAPTLAKAKARVDNYGSAFLAAGASAVIAAGHGHRGYLDGLFTTGQSLLGVWRGHRDFNGNETTFTPTRSTGRAYLDPDSPGAGFYRSIVGNVDLMAYQIVGGKPPRGVVVVPGRDGNVGPTGSRTRGGPSTMRTTLPR